MAATNLSLGGKKYRDTLLQRALIGWRRKHKPEPLPTATPWVQWQTRLLPTYEPSTPGFLWVTLEMFVTHEDPHR